MKIILASKSPRRKSILEDHGYDVVVDASHVDEEAVQIKDVKELVMELAKLKAENVAKRYKSSIIIGADTLVYHEGVKIGQVRDPEEAKRTISGLLGKTHEVYSGVCVINTATGKVVRDFVVSRVKFRSVSDESLESYIKSGLYQGKAGAYNINDPEFEGFVENVEGSYLNIMGLPIEKVKKMISEAEGVE